MTKGPRREEDTGGASRSRAPRWATMSLPSSWSFASFGPAQSWGTTPIPLVGTPCQQCWSIYQGNVPKTLPLEVQVDTPPRPGLASISPRR